MGNCRSKVAPSHVTPSKAVSQQAGEEASPVSGGDSPTNSSNAASGDSTAAFVHAMLPIAKPIVRRAMCKYMIDKGFVLRDEEPIVQFDEFCPDEDLPFRPFEVCMEQLRVMDVRTILNDMEAIPEFEWPERDRVEELMKMVPGVGAGMVVIDLIGYEVKICFDRRVELTVPVKGPLGLKANVEIGSDGSILDAYVRLHIPRLRVWFVKETRKLYVAFMERPDVTPYLHVNVDRGRGDFLEMTFTEEGAFDDVIETVLSGFGPGFLSTKKDASGKNLNARPDQKGSWVADALGRKLVEAIESFAGVGNGRPLEVDLTEQIQYVIDRSIGKPRTEEEIRKSMKKLEMELARAQSSNEKKPSEGQSLTKHKQEVETTSSCSEGAGTTSTGATWDDLAGLSCCDFESLNVSFLRFPFHCNSSSCTVCQ